MMNDNNDNNNIIISVNDRDQKRMTIMIMYDECRHEKFGKFNSNMFLYDNDKIKQFIKIVMVHD